MSAEFGHDLRERCLAKGAICYCDHEHWHPRQHVTDQIFYPFRLLAYRLSQLPNSNLNGAGKYAGC
jgi:hypothetical protein